MSNSWAGLLERRFCKKEGCEKEFRVLPKSPMHYCCETHKPEWEWEKETCWSRGVLREGIDMLKDPRKV